jgi:hypothetical protein
MKLAQLLQQLRGLIWSKVFWFNFVTISLELLNAYASFGSFIAPGQMVMINAVGNVILRFVTNSSLADKKTFL